MGYFIFDNTTNTLDLDEIHHIKDVLRLKPGANIKATDGKGNLYDLRITNLKPFSLEIINIQNIATNTIHIRCIIATIKVPLLELIIQKLTEIGVDEIIVTKTKFAQINLDKLENKLQRWHTIINTACKQSEQVYFPILSIQELDQINYPTNSLNLIGDTQYSKASPIHNFDIKGQSDITLLIGPEGGFSQKEYQYLIEHYAYNPVLFTPYILRAETAAIVGAGIIKNLSL
jgi:16S rRNA (uracil1498-N3)-methyltransferase